MKSNRTITARRAFTLVELLVVIAIIALLAAVALSALGTATEQAKAQRTRAIINKLDQLVMEKWESYRTRAVPFTRDADPRQTARNRLAALRELQRMELPDSINDVWDNPVTLTATPSANAGYRRRAQPVGTWSGQYENAEALYLIIGSMKDGDKSALDYFSSAEVGDVDNDGMKEILDGWGEPIHFLRWAPGYRLDATPPALTTQARSPSAPDPFDPVRVDPKVDPKLNTDPSDDTFALKPLIFSSGPDKEAGVTVSGGAFSYTGSSATSPVNDPYQTRKTPEFGSIYDAAQSADNITNHFRGEQ
jgi:prepilin-type N-terminal cleavage/methylation domain-containing protein